MKLEWLLVVGLLCALVSCISMMAFLFVKSSGEQYMTLRRAEAGCQTEFSKKGSMSSLRFPFRKLRTSLAYNDSSIDYDPADAVFLPVAR